MKKIINLSLLLLALLLPATATAYDFEVDGIYYYIDGDNATVIDADDNWETPDYSGDVTIPETVTYNGTTYSVTSIGQSAFDSCSGLTSVNIPNSVTTIGDYAFADCSGLTSIDIPNSVTSIGSGAFSGCSGLTSIDIPNSITAIGEVAFSYCSGLTSVNIPNSVTAIGRSAFLNCSGLTSVNIPNSVTAIDYGAFADCSGLTSVNIPNSVTAIGEVAFIRCSGLTSVNIPNSVTTIGRSAFYGCSGLTNVTIGNSVTSIGTSAFSNCSGLTSIDIPNSVTSIGGRAFYGCSRLTSVNIPNSVTSIGYEAFYGTAWYNYQPDGLIYAGLVAYKYKGTMSANTHIILREGTLGIAGQAFFGCSGLTSVDIPNSVTSIGEWAFSGCSGLTSVNIPNSVTEIGYRTFYSCSRLTSVNIPNSVTTIGDYAFYGCSGLKDVYSYIESPSQVTMDVSVFYLSTNNYAERTLHVPVGSLEAYQTNTNWNQYFGSIVEMEPEAANYIILPDTTVMHGDIIALPVAMTNDATLMAFQTDIFLPEGFTIVTDEDDEYIITPSERLSSDHVIMSDNANNGSVRVIGYTPNSQPIGGNEGDLFYILVQVPDDAEGPYTINLRNTLLTTVDYTEISAPDTSAQIEVSQFIPGDVNDSRTVNVTDIVVTAMYVLDKNPSPFIFEAADMNGDGNVTVTDIMLIAYLINHPTMNAPKRMPALMDCNDQMSGESVSLMAGETRTVSIMLDNKMDYTAFQMDLTMPEGLTAGNFRLTDRAVSHAFDVNAIAGNKMRALCYSPAIEVINGHSGALLTFDVTANATVEGSITVDGIELVTADCQSVLLNGFAIGVNTATSVSEIVGSKTVARVDYFNLAGQRIDRAESGVTLIVTTYTDGTRTTTKVMK